MFRIGKTVLVFQTRMGKIPGKLRFRWTGPFWITREFNGSYQLGTLAEDVLRKWVNRFRFKPYKGPMPENPFERGTDTESDTVKQPKTGTCVENGCHQAGTAKRRQTVKKPARCTCRVRVWQERTKINLIINLNKKKKIKSNQSNHAKARYERTCKRGVKRYLEKVRSGH